MEHIKDQLFKNDVFERIDYMGKFSSIIMDLELVNYDQEMINNLKSIHRKFYKTWDSASVKENHNRVLTDINLGLMVENQELKKELAKLLNVLNNDNN